MGPPRDSFFTLLLLLPCVAFASEDYPSTPRVKDVAGEFLNALGRVRELETELGSALQETANSQVQAQDGGPPLGTSPTVTLRANAGEDVSSTAETSAPRKRRKHSKKPGILIARREPLQEDIDMTSSRRIVLNILDHHFMLNNRMRIGCTPGLAGLDAFNALPLCPEFQPCPAYLTSLSPHQIGPDIEIGTPLVPEGAMEACSAGFHDDDWDYRPQPPLNCKSWYGMDPAEHQKLIEPYINRQGELDRANTLAMLDHPELACAHRIDFAPETPVAYSVYRMRNVFISGETSIFNRSHVFMRLGCQDSQSAALPMNYAAGEKIVKHVGAVVNWSYRQSNNFFHSLIESFPLFLSLAPIMNKYRDLPLLARREQFKLYGSLLEPLVGVPLASMRRYEMTKKELYHAEMIYQPIYQYCGRSSRSQWHEIRKRHLLHPDGIPIFNPDWSSKGVVPLTEAQMAEIPEDWVVVLAERPPGEPRSIVQAKTLRAGVLDIFPPGRVVVFRGGLTLLEARNLFRKARLYIAAHGAGLANMVFMPTNSSIVEIRPRDYGNNCYHSQADSCSLRYHLLMGEGDKEATLSVNVQEVLALVRDIAATF